MSSTTTRSSLTLFLLHPPPLLSKPQNRYYSLSSPLSLVTTKSLKSHHFICFSSQNDREESRWLREEQRWLREEQRWLREEQRWARDRDSLLREIAELKLKIQALEEGGGGEPETIANIAGLLQILKEKKVIAETGSSSRAMDLEHNQEIIKEEEEEEEEKEEEKEVIAVSEVKEEETKKSRRRDALRKGSEGEEVRAMQEALLKLGFYSGEEDMEFSSFSSGTERAVKTWQASLDLPQDGILTAELLKRLYTEPQMEKGTTTPKEDANGAAVTSVTEISVVKEEGATEVEVSEHRVFLLGENRWEDSSRLSRNQRKGSESKKMDTTTRCVTCRGEGRLLCTECDGTGDINIEEQFLDWVEEGAKCPYCEGVGFTTCDVCEGKAVAA